jgi:pimeloyl-ACP methyl ester carboxylesterase
MDNGRGIARRVLTIVAIAIVIALVWVSVTTLWLWRHQERVVFQPPSTWPDAPAPARRVTFRAADGHSLFGYLLSPQNGSDNGVIVIAFHGNADLAAWTVPWAQEVVALTGLPVLIPEYRGYAGIPGSPTYESAAADARGALAYAIDELRATEIVLFGHSLGSAVATELAIHTQHHGSSRTRALVLQSPFTSAMEMAARMLVPPIPWLWSRISRVHYDTRALVARLDARVYVAHGTRDLNIPSRMGIQVFRSARTPGELLLVATAGHNDVADVGGDRYWQWLTRAMSRVHATADR